MKYTANNGCLFYYDRILYSWRICEPTMLFLLGFESITSFDNSNSDTITISKYVFNESENEMVALKDFDIYDNIYTYLSRIGSVEDHDTYLTFNCNGLKLFMNELTGIHNDRTVPIIFRNDTNSSFINLNEDIIGISSTDRSSMSYYDLQAQKIINIFRYANYAPITVGEAINDVIGEPPELPTSEDIEYSNIYNSKINLYNLYLSEKSKIESEYSDSIELILNDSEAYTRLDYRCMYSYALGVLYGLRRIGYPSYIWRFNPSYWYKDEGKYQNLVKTAWYTFRFHYTSNLRLKYTIVKKIAEDTYTVSVDENLLDKYAGIQVNKLWNYTDEHGDTGKEDEYIPLKDDEVTCYSFKDNNNNEDNDNNEDTDEDEDNDTQYIKLLSYSKSTSTGNYGLTDYPGSYIEISDQQQQWKNINTITNETTGIVDYNKDPIIRYILDKEVKIYEAYPYDKQLINEATGEYEIKRLRPKTDDENKYYYFVIPQVDDQNNNISISFWGSFIKNSWLSDFGLNSTAEDASLYNYPYKCVNYTDVYAGLLFLSQYSIPDNKISYISGIIDAASENRHAFFRIVISDDFIFGRADYIISDDKIYYCIYNKDNFTYIEPVSTTAKITSFKNIEKIISANEFNDTYELVPETYNLYKTKPTT